MAFTVIAGTFHVVGYSPDGDSIRFQPDNPALLNVLGGARPRINAKGHVQLRLEAIDTLETHFKGVHQPLGLAEGAMNQLMALLNIHGIQWSAEHSKVIAANDDVPGYIIAREVEKNGRPVAFAYAGNSPEADGSTLYFSADRLKSSVNAVMLQTGLAYPTYYTGLFADLRAACTDLVALARQQQLGVWAGDVTNSGFDVDSLQSLTDDLVVLPKLFRRLVAYLEGGGSGQGFKAYLESLHEPVTILSNAHATHFDTLIEEQGKRIRMTERPENVMFAS